MKIQKLLLLFAFISISNLSNAQLYKSALGIRLGPSNGVTFKSFINKNAAIEAIATFRYQGIGLTGLYEIHGRAFNSRDFNWFIGGGGHVFLWGNDRPKFLDREQSLVLGLDGILGLEAKLRGIPLAISLDWKPTINIVNYSGFWGDEIALSLRYTW
ncbi:MAG: hypothetical protein H7339_15800 [Arcicella sp.]|nr:hypothetical protein [Arcicella sp.]